MHKTQPWFGDALRRLMGRLVDGPHHEAPPAAPVAADESSLRAWRTILASGLFDPAYYLACNPDVARAHRDPLRDYLVEGAARGRDPSPLFSAAHYLAQSGDAAAARDNPLLHYLDNGGKGSPSPHFDADYYLSCYADVAASGKNPLSHYVLYGAAEGRNPNRWFDTAWYLQRYPDVASSGRNPLAHYLAIGKQEGRLCSPGQPPEAGKAPSNPYAGLPDTSFWRRSVSVVAPMELDPMTSAPFRIGAQDKVATAGSCFAQHIARNLAKSGYRYYVAEPAPEGMGAAEAKARNYGTFSARYGNLYTTRQLLQLFERAYGTFSPAVTAWRRADGRFVDPYRPQLDETGFPDEAAVRAEATAHLAAVRRMFETLDVFVFTLGLTEAWRVKRDGAVLPLAPGVAGGEWNGTEYQFVNFSVEEVQADLLAFVDKLRAVNEKARIILTVSPVPLIATYEDRHVLASTVYSKSVLRVAAEKASRSRREVAYFPSFEIITSTATAHRYFEPDLRSVNEKGVRHVMRVFFRHFTEKARAADRPQGAASFAQEFQRSAAVVCDEEALDRAAARGAGE